MDGHISPGQQGSAWWVPLMCQWGHAGMLDLLPVQHSHVPAGHVCDEARKGGKEKEKKSYF